MASTAHDASAGTPAPQPDVQALDVTWSPAGPQPGDPVKFSALVSNLGNATAQQYTVEFYLMNETGEISYWASYWNGEPLPPGESRWVTGGADWNWGFWTAASGWHIVLVVINDSYNSLAKQFYVSYAPLSSLTATGGDGQISLFWNAVSGATSYNLYRSAASGGEGSVPYRTGLQTTNYTDTPVSNGTTYYYTFTAVGAQGETAQSNEAGATAQPASPGMVRFFPRSDFPSRMVGGKFQGSNDGTSYTDLATITTLPSNRQYTQQALSADPKQFQYLRYLSPNGGCGNIAELEFYSGSTKLTGTPFGTPGSYNNSGNDYTKALDGTFLTFFDAPIGDGAFVGIQQTDPANSGQPDFILTVNPSLNIPKGGMGTLTVNVTPLNNFFGNVGLSVSGLPAGVTAAFSPLTVAGAGGSTLTLTADPNTAAPGPATVTVTGTASPNGPAHSQTLTLTVTGSGGNLTGGPVRLTDLYLPKTLCLEWDAGNIYGHHDADQYQVLRSTPSSNSGSFLPVGVTTNLVFNDQDFVFGTAYNYDVIDHWRINSGYLDPNTNKWVPGPATGTTDLGSISVTPMQTPVTENQAVDARYDPRYSTWNFINHKFGTTTYRGGLFAGYNADNSQVGHSYLKFLLPPPASGQGIWPVASVNAWFTRDYDLSAGSLPGTVGVACQSVPANWDAASLTWSNAPAFSPSHTPQRVSSDPQSPPWVHWPVGADVWGVLNAGGGPYAAALSGTQEPSVGGAGLTGGGSASGWAYFAKKEYAGGQPACLLYALSGSGASAQAAQFSFQPAPKPHLSPAQKKPQPKRKP